MTSLFDTLNRAREDRPNNLPKQLAEFPHINGALFKDNLAQCYFDEAGRKTLIECARLDWSEISPAIFGSLFQAIMHFDDEAATGKSKKRREFGAHYTSEENILKVIRPLFLDDLYAQFKKCGRNKKDMAAFHKYLSGLDFFDPACGCSNFLVIAYRELRLLELEVIEAIWSNTVSNQLDIDTLILCDVHQFHGTEIDESAVQIATVALWLSDHQMNLKVQHFGLYYKRIPLVKKANIVCANALRLNWAEVLPPEKCNFIMGNPPFVGYSYQTRGQKADLAEVFKGMNGAGVLDLVAAWHVTAALYIQANPAVPVAFVSTNSLTQGEQVAILWTELLKFNIKLRFAHRTFRWSNEGKGIAAVHCVIMGFHLAADSNVVGEALASAVEAKASPTKAAPTNKFAPTVCRLFDYGDDIAGDPVEIQAKQINPYLVDAPAVLIEKRRKPLCVSAPEINFGSKPTDGGHLLLSQEEADAIRQTDPIAAKYIRPFLGSEEFINGVERYCLWLKDSTAADRKASQEIRLRMQTVKAMRLASPKLPTQKLAELPYLFGEIRQSDQSYIGIPKTSSERRAFLPIGLLSGEVVAGSELFAIPNATLYHFGVLCSTMHNAWMRTVCGRLKSDYRYSSTIVYNNFPWPQAINPEQQAKIEVAAQLVLNARASEENRCAEQGQKCSLAALYASGNMPTGLLKAHNQLDKAVDAAYGYKPVLSKDEGAVLSLAEGSGKDDAARVAFLFERYQQLLTVITKPD